MAGCETRKKEQKKVKFRNLMWYNKRVKMVAHFHPHKQPVKEVDHVDPVYHDCLRDPRIYPAMGHRAPHAIAP